MFQKKLCVAMVVVFCLCMAGCADTPITPTAATVTKTEQKATEQSASVPVVKTEQIKAEQKNSIGMKFVYIPPGMFMMGSPSDEQNIKSSSLVKTSDGKVTTFELGEKITQTQHKVTLTKGFYMQTTEVTQGQWKAIMGNNPSKFSNCGDNCPVDMVSWDDTQVFIQKLNKKEGTIKYRLPSEAEWEYAARAGTTTAYNWGNSPDCSKANYGNSLWTNECKGKNIGQTIVVGTFLPNIWGLYDMHGNVAEWCQDFYGAYPSGAVIDPTGPNSGSARVLRGGSWLCRAQDCLSSQREGFSSNIRDSYSGFRLVRSE